MTRHPVHRSPIGLALLLFLEEAIRHITCDVAERDLFRLIALDGFGLERFAPPGLVRQRRSRFALMPRAIATAAIDMPGCAAAAMASALNSSLCKRRRRRPGASLEPIVSTCPPRV